MRKALGSGLVRSTILLLITLVGAASVLYALPTIGGDVEYYDSPSLVNQVGDWQWFCDANQQHWGVKTQYYEMLDAMSCSHPEYCCWYHLSGYYMNGVWHDTGSGIECAPNCGG